MKHWKFREEVWVMVKGSNEFAAQWHYINSCADDGSDILFGAGGGIDPNQITHLSLERPKENLCPHCLKAAKKDRREFLAELRK